MLKKFFGDREFNKKLVSIVLPIALQQLTLAIVSASDAIMLNLISQEKMSAVSLATQITFVENLFLAAMTIGLSTLAAQYWGKKDERAVEKIFAYAVKITVAVSFFFFFAALCFPIFLMRLLTNEPTLIEGGAEYLRLVSPSYLLTGVAQLYFCILKNSGRAKTAGIVSSVCMLGDALMNALFIVGLFGLPRLEIAGAAISTTLARAVEVLWCVGKTSKNRGVKLRATDIFHTDKLLRKDFWKYATPVLGNEMIWGVGFASFSVILGHVGANAVAANSVANIVKNLVCCLCLGLSSGGGILVGNALGAGELEKAKDYGGKLCGLSVFVGAASGLVILALRPLIVKGADLNGESTGYLKFMLVVCSYYVIGKSVNCATIAGIFCAGGDGKFGLICDAVVMWGIVLPLGALAAFVFRLPVAAVYFILNLDELLKLPAVYVRYKKYFWIKNLTKKGD